MAVVRYGVVITGASWGYRAQIEELQCVAIGATIDEAVEKVREKALDVLDEFDGQPLPSPFAQSVVTLELPKPKRKDRHLVAV